MSDIQRYDAWPQECPFEDKNGEFVTYEDHIKIVKELEAKLAMAVETLRSIAYESVEEEGIYAAKSALVEIEGEKND